MNDTKNAEVLKDLTPEASALLLRGAAQRGRNFFITQTLTNRFAVSELFVADLVEWVTGDVYRLTQRGLNLRAVAS